AAEIVSQLVQRDAGVTVVMTKSATQFVGPLTFQTLTRRRCFSDQFDVDAISDPTHITLTDKAELVLLAPATADLLAKAAHGIADEMLTALLLAVDCPVLVAPAMNQRMWEHPATKANVKTLEDRGYRFVDPQKGFLACGHYAKGRLAEPADILEAVKAILK
ncbi:MAG TPA: flavoprotein, partial [Planctomycetota bacterium]